MLFYLSSEIGMLILSSERQKIEWAMKEKKKSTFYCSRDSTRDKNLYTSMCVAQIK